MSRMMVSCSKCHSFLDTEWELLYLSEKLGFPLSDVKMMDNARSQIRNRLFVCAQCCSATPEIEADTSSEDDPVANEENGRIADEIVAAWEDCQHPRG